MHLGLLACYLTWGAGGFLCCGIAVQRAEREDGVRCTSAALVAGLLPCWHPWEHLSYYSVPQQPVTLRKREVVTFGSCNVAHGSSRRPGVWQQGPGSPGQPTYRGQLSCMSSCCLRLHGSVDRPFPRRACRVIAVV